MVHPVEEEYRKGLVIYPTTNNMKVISWAWEEENEKIVKSVELLEDQLGKKYMCFSYWKKKKNELYIRLPFRGATWYPLEMFNRLMENFQNWLKF